MPAPQVTVAEVIAKKVTDFDEFTGRFEAVDRVEIRPRVSGYISSVNFTEGSEVKKGDVLFVIDQRPYAADLKRARAQLAQARAQAALAQLRTRASHQVVAAAGDVPGRVRYARARATSRPTQTCRLPRQPLKPHRSITPGLK